MPTEDKIIENKIASLILNLESTNANTKRNAVIILGNLEQVARPAIPALAKILTNSQEEDIKQILLSLDKIDPEWRTTPEIIATIPKLVQQLTNINPNIQQNTLVALENIAPQWAFLPEVTAMIPDFIATLIHAEDETTRWAVAWALGKIGPACQSSIPDLITMLSSPDKILRQYAVWILGTMGIGAQQAIGNIMLAIADQDTAVAESAMEALEKISPDWATTAEAQRTITKFMRSLVDDNDDVRKRVKDTLILMGNTAQSAIPVLAMVLTHRIEFTPLDIFIRKTIASIFCNIKPKWIHATTTRAAIPALIQIFVNTHEIQDSILQEVKTSVTTLLSKIPNWYSSAEAQLAIPSLITALIQGASKTQLTAIKLLTDITPVSQDAISALMTISLNSKSNIVRLLTIEKLTTIKPLSPYIICHFMIAALLNNYSDTRVELILALKRMPDPTPQDAVQTFIEALTDQDIKMRQTATEALSVLNDIAQPAIPHLIRNLEYKDPDLRRATAKTLVKIQPVTDEMMKLLANKTLTDRDLCFTIAILFSKMPNNEVEKIIPIVIKGLSDTNHILLQEAIIKVLGLIGGAARQAIPELMILLLKKRPLMASIKRTLRYIDLYWWRTNDAQKAYPCLIESLFHKHSRIRATALDILGKIPNWETLPIIHSMIPFLITSLSNPHPGVCRVAATILGKLKMAGSASVPNLIAMLTHENLGVRLAVANALRQIWPPLDQMIPVWCNLLQDTSPKIRSIAISALQFIHPPVYRILPNMIQALSDTNREVQCGAATILAYMGDRAKEAIPALIASFNKRQINLFIAVSAFGAIGVPDSESNEIVETLIQILIQHCLDLNTSRKFSDDKIHAILQTLSKLDQQWAERRQMQEVIPSLATNLFSDQNCLYQKAGIILEAMGTSAQQAIPLIEESLERNTENIEFLKKVLDKIALPINLPQHILIFNLANGNVYQRIRAAEKFTNLDTLEEDAIPALIRALADNVPLVSNYAEVALKKIPFITNEIIGYLLLFRHHNHVNVRMVILEMLEKLAKRQPKFLEYICEAILDDDPNIRLKMIEILHHVKNWTHGIVQTLEQARHDSDSRIRQSAERCLDPVNNNIRP